MNRRWGFIVSAVLGIAAFPPLSLWPLAYVAMVAFLWSATELSAEKVAGRAWVAGYVFFAGVLYWVGLNSGAPWWMSAISAALMIAILATVWSITAWAVQRTARALSVESAALIFVTLYFALEIFWGSGEMGFPWAVWGLALSGSVSSIQIAEWVDVPGLSLWVLSCNALVFLFLVRRDRRIGGIALSLIVLPILWGAWRSYQVDESDTMIRAAVVQANTDSETKWQRSGAEILLDHVAITDSLIGQHADFIAWSETAVPVPIRYRRWAADTLSSLAERTGAVLLTGATDYRLDSLGEAIPLNAAFVIRPGAHHLESSSKVHLVPFGERIPGQSVFPFLRNLHLGQAEFQSADSVVVFPTGETPPFSCLICFEVVFPEVAAEAVLGGAQFFGHITNDGWYGNSSGPYQHLALTRLRAVATRRAIVRAANTGISALVLPSGRYVTTLGFDRAGYRIGEIPARSDVTLAVRLAKVWQSIAYGLLLVVISALWMRTRRYGTSEQK
ncbi:MAG: apolipoprotein N-acyltransferase [Calditrichaeota bacterium]|nr:apolipoprotein N-acyltransferase [Calditrichota bacterium]MCB9391556.1 apolipoprotein N-acyltransferase [Calditrichota bacterium]